MASSSSACPAVNATASLDEPPRKKFLDDDMPLVNLRKPRTVAREVHQAHKEDEKVKNDKKDKKDEKNKKGKDKKGKKDKKDAEEKGATKTKKGGGARAGVYDSGRARARLQWVAQGQRRGKDTQEVKVKRKKHGGEGDAEASARKRAANAAHKDNGEGQAEEKDVATIEEGPEDREAKEREKELKRESFFASEDRAARDSVTECDWPLHQPRAEVASLPGALAPTVDSINATFGISTQHGDCQECMNFINLITIRSHFRISLLRDRSVIG